MLHLEALAEATRLTPKQLAAKHGDEAARWALLQIELRKRAVKKFGDKAEQMLFDREALEQATSLPVARYHASHFPKNATVHDLTAGIGGDAFALAERGPVIAYESDPIRAELARHNLENHNAKVLQADGQEILLSEELEYIWADPDRRSPTGRRLSRPEDYSPDPETLATMLSLAKVAGMKLSPLLPDDYLENLGGALEFVSYQNECLEAIVWFGSEKPTRQAVIINFDGSKTEIEASPEPPVTTKTPLAFIHDADPAVIRAHCLGTFGHAQLGDSTGYLTSNELSPNPAYRTYQVLATANPNQVKAELRKINGKAYELKQRGTNLDSTKVLRELSTNGDCPISLFAYRIGASIRYVLTMRVG